MNWSSQKKTEGIFLLFIFSEGIFLTFVLYLNVQCIEYTFTYIHTFTYQKALLHTLLLRVFKIVKSLQCILNTFISLNNFSTYSVTQSKTSCINVRYDSQKFYILLMYVFSYTIKVSKKSIQINLQTKPCLKYNLRITTALNRKLSGLSLVPIKMAKNLQVKAILVFKLLTN